MGTDFEARHGHEKPVVTAAPSCDGRPGEEGQAEEAGFEDRLIRANINPETRLATDYLNHFNEVVMVLEMLPDMPDCLDEAEAWQPCDYCAHFRESSFAERTLAIAAYDRVPARVRALFEDSIRALDAAILSARASARDAIGKGMEAEVLRAILTDPLAEIRERQALAGQIITGFLPASRPETGAACDGETAAGLLNQADVDALFDDRAGSRIRP